MAFETGNGRSSGKCPLTSNGAALETVLPPLDLFLQCFKKMLSLYLVGWINPARAQLFADKNRYIYQQSGVINCSGRWRGAALF
jgi:hypothetical protein